MKILYLAREFPPNVYGGAGVHLEHLARAMAALADVEVRCFGETETVEGNPRVVRFPYGDAMFDGNPDLARGALGALHTCLRFNALPSGADVVHCHTWYSHFGGILGKLAYGMPLVITVHSLEPLRPWKREQLGRGYDVSSWIERTALEMADAIIAVSGGDREEILRRFAVDPARVHVLPNGVDPEVYRPVPYGDVLARRGIAAARPFVLFLGRMSRQKGITHFLRAAELLSPEVDVVLVASSPDTPEVERDVVDAVTALQARRPGVTWIREMVRREEAVALYTAAAVFCCPSVYEPFGIINLEAMACETPVVGTAVGGIREIVIPEETGILVPFTARSLDDPEPVDAERLARDLAAAIDRLVGDAELSAAMGRRGRQRVLEHYGWDRVARHTLEVYEAVLARRTEPANAGAAVSSNRSGV